MPDDPMDRRRRRSARTARLRSQAADDWTLLHRDTALPFLFIVVLTASFTMGNAQSQPNTLFTEDTEALLQEFCIECHNDQKSKGKINLAALLRQPSIDEHFKTWELVGTMLQEAEMPPEDEPQPSAAERRTILGAIQQRLEHSKQAQAGDPGPVILRRLTSAEYNYTVQDLTGIDLSLDRLIASDAVGGEGFANVGEVQFVQDATLERYLEAAKTVASHALIGAGPLSFIPNPGRTGQELSAIHRIQKIYRQHGFRTGAGEGAEAFGLDQYPRAFFAAWRFQHRQHWGEEQKTLYHYAQQEALHPGFVQHIWSVLQNPAPSFPTSETIKNWRDLPAPSVNNDLSIPSVRDRCTRIYERLATWQRGLAANTEDDEEAAVLAENGFTPTLSHRFRTRLSWPEDSGLATVHLSVHPTQASAAHPTIVHWIRPQLFVRTSSRAERGRPTAKSLRDFLSVEQQEQLGFGKSRGNTSVDDDSFLVEGALELTLQFPVPPESRGGSFNVSVRLDHIDGGDGLVRCAISDGLVEGETIASTGESAALLANPDSPQLETWQAGIKEFAQQLPQVSHREPAPSDRDPIPAPWDNSYNNAERNRFHYVVKYHRDDRFLTNHLIDDATRRSLDDAWTDLLMSFDYHDTFLQFVASKYEFSQDDAGIADLTQSAVNQIASEPRRYVRWLFEDYQHGKRALNEAEEGHLNDAIDFAKRAWRRSLKSEEADRLRRFYWRLRQDPDQDHDAALRSLLARILVSPAFIYRLETHTQDAISDVLPTELANRLSFFLWSSGPDKHLHDLAATGKLVAPFELENEIRRLLKAPQIRRFASEFFGQWLGFYQFDHFRGVDAERFPEFTETIKQDMFAEAVSFFEYVMRHDRPIGDLLFADYTFLTPALAKHYGVSSASITQHQPTRATGLQSEHRGGLLQLGAILTSTSAPLRTSAVKRGDWILRRILGTPVPPPPADAGSIPADDILDDGLTVRARLEAHRKDPTCANCHSRIDPLGFALEHFDAIGRWREGYRDGQQIDDSGILSDGSEIRGIDGLHTYLRQNAALFQRNLATKMLGYALGRSTLISDQALIDDLANTLTLETPISELIVRIVQSPQFQKKRGPAHKTGKGKLDSTTELSKLTL